jgi:hypothetical protein
MDFGFIFDMVLLCKGGKTLTEVTPVESLAVAAKSQARLRLELSLSWPSHRGAVHVMLHVI